MRRVLTAFALVALMTLGFAPVASAHDTPACADFGGLGWKNHGEHVLLAYVHQNSGGPGAHGHLLGDTSPGASFCVAHANAVTRPNGRPFQLP